MDTFLGRYRNLLVLAAILFAQIIGLALQVRRPSDAGETRLIRLWAVSAVTPIESAVIHIQEWVANLWTTYIYLHGVRRENRELRAEIGQMKIEEARLSEDARMARRIQSLLAFKEQYIDSTIAAQVIGTSGSEQSRVLYIDKGSNDGITVDMAVITPGGIVGKIAQVFPDSAQVLPINDQFSGVGAALKDSRLQGILKGAPNGATTLQYIMSDEKVVPGEEVITSGGDRIFPKGLPIGKVVSASPGKDLFLNVSVTPSANLNRLEEVLVITKIEEREPDAEAQGPIRAADILAERLPSVPDKTGGTVPAGTVKPTAGAQAAPAAATSTQPTAKPGTASLAKPGSTTSATAGAATPRATPRPPAPKTASSGATPASNGNDSAPKPNGANGAGPKPASLAAKPPAAGATDKAGPEGSGPGKPEPSEAPAKPSPSATETRAPGAAKSVSDQGPNASGDSRSSPAAANGTP